MIIASHAIIYTEMKRNSWSCMGFLLQKRTLMTKIYPGHWSLIGGCINEPESHFECVKREMDEEFEDLTSKVKFDPIDTYTILPIYGYPGKYISCFSGMILDDMSVLKVVGYESHGFGFFTVEEVHHLLMCPEHRSAIDQFVRSIK